VEYSITLSTTPKRESLITIVQSQGLSVVQRQGMGFLKAVVLVGEEDNE
jgi:hypothetical protein